MSLLQAGDRPFICSGSPLACKIFIVGCNPATGGAGFQEHFGESGFDYGAWWKDYLDARQKSGKRTKASPTRRNIRIISEVLQSTGLSALETNVYATPSTRKSLLSPKDQDTAVFDFLLQSIGPTLLFIHGKDACRAIEQRIKGPLVGDGWNRIGGRKCYCVLDRHLSYRYSGAEAERTGRKLAHLYQLHLAGSFP
ncbi:hypothetical protein V9K67_22060 [Paraflavisolibacter sp. H34]|uniref:hypothetical protein n=1 Tax=Huijunlia imazamoxiresistens TaxID=3127457 RepID=UPI00301A3855